MILCDTSSMTILWPWSLTLNPTILQNSFLKEFPTKLFKNQKFRSSNTSKVLPVDEKVDPGVEDGGEVRDECQGPDGLRRSVEYVCLDRS